MVSSYEITSCPLVSEIWERITMCDEKTKCQKPENLSGSPGECSPEQIKECHDDVKEHPCVTKKEKNQTTDSKK